MADPTSGVIVTQQGVDVVIAADYQKVVDTRWRFLDIQFEQEFTISHADSGATHWWVEKLFDHNLGFLPAFNYRAISLDNGGNSFVTINNSLLQIIATDTSVYLRNLYVSGDPTTPIVLKCFIRLYNLDITTEYAAPISFGVPGAPVLEPDIGIKILTNEGDINSTDLSKFTIDTKGKAFAIQQTGVRTAASPDYSLTIDHHLGYPPTYFLAQVKRANEWNSVFKDPLGVDTIFPMVVPFGARIVADTNNVIVKGSQSALAGSYAFLITKEPTELAV